MGICLFTGDLMDKTKIEYCDSTYNPVSGCLNDCPYCYARRIAHRYKGCLESPDGLIDTEIIKLKERKKYKDKNGKENNAAYPYGFTPTLHEYRLNDLQTKGYGKTIFVCSMADLFGSWIPDEWIEKVFQSCLDAPNHRYLFLTKNPKRYIQLAKREMLPKDDNFWYGSTAERETDEIFYSNRHHTFASIEPIMEPFIDCYIPDVEWVIIGAETGNRSEKVIPERSWIDGIVRNLQDKHIPVFMKDSMKPLWGDNIITQVPWKNE